MSQTQNWTKKGPQVFIFDCLFLKQPRLDESLVLTSWDRCYCVGSVLLELPASPTLSLDYTDGIVVAFQQSSQSELALSRLTLS